MLHRKATLSMSAAAVGALIAAAPLGSGPLAAAASHPSIHVPAPKVGKDGRVIVVLKDQPQTAHFARAATNHSSSSAQAAERARVASAIRSSGGTVVHSFSLVNVISAKVTSAQAAKLAQRGDVAEVVPDSVVHVPSPHAADAAAADDDGPAPTTPVPGACPATNNGVKLEPEALEATRANSDVPGAKTARSLGYTGHGVTVGYIAEGIDINNPDFIRDGKSIFTDYQNFTGEGTNVPTDGAEAFLDASAIAAQANETYDISHFSKLPLDRPCKIKVEGEAPGVNLVGLDVFGSTNDSFSSVIVQAIEWAVNHDHVNVLNESLGGNPFPDDSGALDIFKAANDAAVAKGVTITASSGDAGITNTIGSPATDTNVIAVGGSTTYRFHLQTGYGGARLPGITSWTSNNITSLSSGGFDQTAHTVALVAPGELNFAVCSKDLDMYFGCADYAGDPLGLEASGGTSESAPTVAGVAALVIEAYQQGHSGNSPTPVQIKDILTSSADDIDAPADQQGAGLVDAYKAVQLAKAYGSGPATGSALRSSRTHFTAIDAAKKTHTFQDTVTNRGTTPQTVAVSSRTLGSYDRIATTKVTLSDSDSQKYVDFQGITDNYEKVNFSVPANQDRLLASIAWQAASSSLAARVRLTLVDPNGVYSAYSLPQGIGNYGHVEVAKPTTGNWTAYIQSRESAAGGTEGVVHFAAGTANYVPFGQVSPTSLSLAPGASKTVTLKVNTKSVPGDLAGSLLLSSVNASPGARKPALAADEATSTIPVTLRTRIPAGTQSFPQVLRGGNGRETVTGQQFFYQVDVPKGTPELNAAIKLADDPDNPFSAELVSPNGNATAFASNTLLETNPFEGQIAPHQKGAQLHTLNPTPGHWQLIVAFAPVVSGDNITTPFTVSTDDKLRTASAAGLPNSSKVVLKPGVTKTFDVKVKNTGNSPEAFFLDPRRKYTTTYLLKSITGSSATVPFDPNSEAAPTYLVPSNTTSIGAAAATDGDTDINFDLNFGIGDPDLGSTTGKQVLGTYAANPVAPGLWNVVPQEIGPFSDNAGTPENVETRFAARTRGFDSQVKSTTGDLWLGSRDPSIHLNAVTVDPGDTAVIEIKVKPTAGHRTVAGTIFVDDANLVAFDSYIEPTANQVAAIPYKYTVK